MPGSRFTDRDVQEQRRALWDAVWVRAGGRCEVRSCGAIVDRANWEGHVHHVVYRGFGAERLDDLQLRCLACHGAAHPERTFRTRAEQTARHTVRPSRSSRRRKRQQPQAGLTTQERNALTHGAGWWAYRPPSDAPTPTPDFRGVYLATLTHPTR